MRLQVLVLSLVLGLFAEPLAFRAQPAGNLQVHICCGEIPTS